MQLYPTDTPLDFGFTETLILLPHSVPMCLIVIVTVSVFYSFPIISISISIIVVVIAIIAGPKKVDL